MIIFLSCLYGSERRERLSRQCVPFLSCLYGSEQAWTDIKKAPIGQALGKITFPTGGSCPVQSVELFGKSVMFDSHCSLWAQIEPILKAVFLAFWALLSVRVFLSA